MLVLTCDFAFYGSLEGMLPQTDTGVQGNCEGTVTRTPEVTAYLFLVLKWSVNASLSMSPSWLDSASIGMLSV